MQGNPNTDPGTSPGRAATIAVLAISSLTIMANATISPSLPGLAKQFADTPEIESLLGLMLSLPSLTIILTAALFGIAAERFGRKPVLLVALVLYAIGGASGLTVDTMSGLLAGRVVLGLGVAGTMTVATMLAGDLWTGQARMKFMGKQAAFMSLGGIIFIALGGFLAEASWRGAFGLYLLSLPIAVFAMLGLGAEPAKNTNASPDKAPLDWAICLKVGTLAFLTMGLFYVIPVRLPFIVQQVGVTSTTVSGLALASVTFAGMLASINYQRIGQMLSPVGIYALGFGCFAVGYGLIATAGGLPQVIIGSMVSGVALGAIMPNQNNWLMGSVHPQARGRAAGVLTTFVFAGQFAGPLFAGVASLFVSLHGIFAVFAIAAGVLSVTLMILARSERG